MNELFEKLKESFKKRVPIRINGDAYAVTSFDSLALNIGITRLKHNQIYTSLSSIHKETTDDEYANGKICEFDSAVKLVATRFPVYDFDGEQFILKFDSLGLQNKITFALSVDKPSFFDDKSNYLQPTTFELPAQRWF